MILQIGLLNNQTEVSNPLIFFWVILILIFQGQQYLLYYQFRFQEVMASQTKANKFKG
ncbi:unnamed protein product [Paramecium octaurelia]|uniref:Uncharacterized protein n=1 Tax=Paramecium octaurelia TaxID=43137 RepID=A0A8S1Y643_PAROT|nr:unnamed protein product [Paramecium octaurelia]